MSRLFRCDGEWPRVLAGEDFLTSRAQCSVCGAIWRICAFIRSCVFLFEYRWYWWRGDASALYGLHHNGAVEMRSFSIRAVEIADPNLHSVLDDLEEGVSQGFGLEQVQQGMK